MHTDPLTVYLHMYSLSWRSDCNRVLFFPPVAFENNPNIFNSPTGHEKVYNLWVVIEEYRYMVQIEH